MEKMTKTTPFVWLAMLFIYGACAREEITGTSGGGGTELDVQFTVRLPESATATRALSGTDENEVREVQLLAFEPDNGAFSYTSYAKKIASSPGVSEEIYVAKLRTGNCDLMVLVNSNAYITASFPSKIDKGTSRETVISSLQMTLADKWITTSGTNYKPIPMWGIKEDVNVNKDTDLSGDNSFDVTRALAKINVLVDLEQGHAGTFELTSVRYHNRRTKGQLIPTDWNIASTHVQQPSVVAGDAGIETALLYDGTEITDDKNCQNEIYVLEAPKGSRDAHPKYPCLVVGGKYNNTPGYYRIDFSNKENTTDPYIPILRNHTYSIIITKVDGDGFTDPDDAYKSLPVNIEADIIDWNPQTIGDIYFDGQHYLSLEKGRYELPWKALTELTPENIIKIKTDYPDGWEWLGTEYDANGSDWLTFSGGNKGLKDDESERWLELHANPTRQPRTATITIAAGRIRGKIIVTQEASPDARLIVRDKDGNEVGNNAVITYKSDNWDIQECEYTIEWIPENELVTVSLVNPVNNYSKMEFADDSQMVKNGDLLSSATGEHTFGFNIAPFDTSAQKQQGNIDLSLKSAIQYTFTVGQGKDALTHTFIVENELLDVQAIKIGPCKQGRLYELEVAYNTPWELYLEGETSILDSRTLGDIPSEGGISGQTGRRTIRFRMEVGEEYDGKEIDFRFVKPGTAQRNIYDVVKAKSCYNFPNSYIVGTNSSFEFKVLKAYRMAESPLIGSPLKEGDMDVKLLWTDRADEFIVISSLQLDKNTTNPEQSVIKGTTNAEYGGNALIALMIDGEVVWSWHIWVVDYSPNKDPSYYYNSGIMTTLMDRNLGAWFDGFDSERTYGLYYQWGRKDPFLGPSTMSGRGQLGDGGNVTHTYDGGYYMKTQSAPGGENSLAASIKNPNLFYTASAYPNDWYAHSSGSQNSDLWYDYDGLKSDFDPCPDGWRTGGCFWVGKQFYYTWAFIPKGDDPRGWDYTGYLNIGKYPKAGYLRGDNGYYDLTGEECWLWYGNHSGQDIDGTIGEHESLIDRTFVRGDSEQKRTREGRNRANGVPVRCERDERDYWYR